MSELCNECGGKLAAHAPNCPNCGIQVGYPNVRAANREVEVEQLNVRLQAALASADVRGCRENLDAFGIALLSSRAVMARNISVLGVIVSSDRALYTTYHEQVRAGSRIPEDNNADQVRGQIESAFFPNYYQHINYAALSLDGRGIDWFGGYYITFKEKMIQLRTSVFDENVFDFADHHALPLNRPPPTGYRSTWGRRNELGVAKLSSRLRPDTQPADYPALLLHQPAEGAARCDYVEVHIYGPLSGSAIESVRAPKPTNRTDGAIWMGIREQLEALGVAVDEF